MRRVLNNYDSPWRNPRASASSFFLFTLAAHTGWNSSREMFYSGTLRASARAETSCCPSTSRLNAPASSSRYRNLHTIHADSALQPKKEQRGTHERLSILQTKANASSPSWNERLLESGHFDGRVLRQLPSWRKSLCFEVQVVDEGNWHRSREHCVLIFDWLDESIRIIWRGDAHM